MRNLRCSEFYCTHIEIHSAISGVGTHLGGAVKTALNVCIHALVLEAAAAEIDNLDG